MPTELERKNNIERATKYYYLHREEILAAMKSKENRKRRRNNSKNSRVRWKREAFNLLGNKCVRCGFADPRALQIDHINGGGSKLLSHRRCTSFYYRQVALDPEAQKHYQTLCANCNWIKRAENHEINQWKDE